MQFFIKYEVISTLKHHLTYFLLLAANPFSQLGGGKKMASLALFERNSCSTSEPTLNEARTTSGDNAFHVAILPAKWVKIGLQHNITLLNTNQNRTMRDFFFTFCNLMGNYGIMKDTSNQCPNKRVFSLFLTISRII